MVSPLEQSLVRAHRFVFAPAFQVAAWPFGIHAGNAGVELHGTHLTARFGPWTVSTPIANVVGTEVTGPYAWPKVIGPPHVSFVDRGLTFASNRDRGLCIAFREPVAGLDPAGWLRHPSLTVTVEHPEDLMHDIAAASGQLDELERDERALLEGQTASELRERARRSGVPKASSMRKAELIDHIIELDELAAAVVEDTLTETAS